MAFLKCKMCGGALEIQDGAATCECEYCGTVQTVPVNQDANVQNLFNRANSLRMKSEFDKAEELYDKILQITPNESEAFWGLILCRYGVEYVEDPKTMKRVPTCHRASYESVTADDDYKNALRYAEKEQKKLYEEEARTIDEIQKGILAVSQKEEPYDVFICYKETDENGKRTQDSVIANDIYYQLSHEGYKVFFAAITLENKLGTEYEPYIFSALNTARVMLVIGTKPEYFQAVWVRNEWSRFLAVMKKDRSKILIPCYRNMDAYDLPEEFSHLQAQDMSKIGFINDLIRGIKKVIVKKEEAEKSVEEKQRRSEVNTDALLRRALLSLEDKDWLRADEFCEQVLNSDPENPYAYLYQLMAECRVSKKEQLSECAQPFDGSNHYKNTVRFADPSLQRELQADLRTIKERNEEKRKRSVYEKALTLSKKNDSQSLSEALSFMKSISGWKDADEKAGEISERYNALLAEENDRKQRISVLNQQYDAKYYNPLAAKKNGIERKLAEISDQVQKQSLLLLEKEQKRSTGFPHFVSLLLGFLKFVIRLGVLLFGILMIIAGIAVAGNSESGLVVFVIIGLLCIFLFIRMKDIGSGGRKKLLKLQNEQLKASDELREIEQKIAMLPDRAQYIANVEKDYSKAVQEPSRKKRS